MTVKNADAMDDATFELHINKRHVPIGGLTAVRYTDKTLRAYHRHVHHRGVEDNESRPVNHQHREAQT